MKKLKFLTVAFLIFILCGFAVLADDAAVIYSGHANGIIFEPGSIYSSSDLFPNFKNLMPGDEVTQKITVSCGSVGKVKTNIYMRALGANAGSEEFLSKLTLKVKLNKNNSAEYLFDASASETDGLTDWVLLGTLYPGGKINLDVTLQIPTSLDTKFQYAVGELDWEFLTEEIRINDPNFPTPVLPVEPTEKKDINVQINWADNDNADGMRPEAVTVHLVSSGGIYQSAEINSEKNWSHTYKDMTATRPYEVRIDDIIEGYTIEYSGDENNGFIITLTYNKSDAPDTPDKPVEPDIPDEPDTPDVPDTPDEPDVPDVPDTPDEPDIPDEPIVPPTGDNSRLTLWIVLAICSLISMTISIVLLIKNRRQDNT